jgi:hypothetical protein
MKKATGVVEAGRILLPEEIRLPDGMRVLVEWDEDHPDWGPPLEREPWSAAAVQKEIEWARQWRWDRSSS